MLADEDTGAESEDQDEDQVDVAAQDEDEAEEHVIKLSNGTRYKRAADLKLEPDALTGAPVLHFRIVAPNGHPGSIQAVAADFVEKITPPASHLPWPLVKDGEINTSKKATSTAAAKTPARLAPKGDRAQAAAKKTAAKKTARTAGK